VSSVGVVLRERLVSRREREAREELRNRDRTDARGAFQRENILALQAAIEDVYLIFAGAKADHLAYRGSPQFSAALYRVDMLTSRVLDDELRSSAKRWHTAMANTVGDDPNHTDLYAVMKSQVLAKEINDRVNVLLKELF
jgi:hypothetical protein